MSEANADDFDLIEVELILEREGTVIMKIPKGYTGPLPGIDCEGDMPFVNNPASQEFFNAVDVEWHVDTLEATVWGKPTRTVERVFDARQLIEEGGREMSEANDWFLRTGKFSIPFWVLDERSAEVAQLLSGMVILDARAEYAYNHIAYTARSLRFDPCKEGVVSVYFLHKDKTRLKLVRLDGSDTGHESNATKEGAL
jgi:hypothetical protein